MLLREWMERVRITPVQGAVLAVLVGSSLSGLLFHHLTFHGLRPEALDIAQLARNISNGQGFTTSCVRPLALSHAALRPGAAAPATPAVATPELLHEPLYPLLLGVVMAIIGARDGAVWGLSLALYILSTGLLFAVAQRLSGNLAAACATAGIYALAIPVLVLADAGSPLMLSAALLPALLLVLLPPRAAVPADGNVGVPEAGAAAAAPPEVSGPRAIRSQDRRFWLAGVLTALCFLTDYVSLGYVLPLAVMCGQEDQRWNRRTAGVFALGCFVTVLPWWIRNARLTGNPFYTLQWLDFAMYSGQYPGHSLLRDFYLGKSLPLPFCLPEIKPLIAKVLGGVVTYFEAAPRVPHLYLMPFIVVASWLPVHLALSERFRRGVLLVTVSYILLLCVLGRQEASYLVPLAGLLTYIGVVTLQRLSMGCLGRLVELSEEEPGEVSPARILRIEAAFWSVTALLLMLPLAWQTALLMHQPATVDEVAAVGELSQVLPEGRFVMTDVPWAVAWYGRRPAIWLPKDPDQLAAIAKTRPVGTVYLSAAMPRYQVQDGFSLWQRTYQQGSAIIGFDAVRRPQWHDLVYVGVPSVAEARQARNARPKDLNLQLRLARAYLAAHDPRAALAAYRAVPPRGAIALEVYRGLGIASVGLHRYPDAIRWLGQALKVAPRDQKTLLLTAAVFVATGRPERAMELYEAVLADTPEQPEAVNNLAFLYTRDNRHPYRAVEMARRAVAADPDNASKWDTLGWASYRAGRANEAVGMLQQAVQRTPEVGLMQYHLGKALIAAGHQDTAIPYLTTALQRGLPPTERQDARAILARNG